jgi:putative sigma-54 modulation protein
MSMKYLFTGKNIEIKPAAKDYIIKRFDKIGKFFHSDAETDVTLSMQKKVWIFEATMEHKGLFFRAEERNEDLFTAVDKAVDVIESQIRKNKTKIERKLYDGTARIDIVDCNEDVDQPEEYRIIRKKTVSAKPMNAEEAILQMNLLGHEFFMFTNEETNEINVVYKRKEGHYGLIGPEK